MHPMLRGLLDMSERRGLAATDNFARQLRVQLAELRNLLGNDTSDEGLRLMGAIDKIVDQLQDYQSVRTTHQAWLNAKKKE